ncbi:regulation of nuclear pre-mRNA domain-containing protein 2-like [Symsagittifera roscoffensis]|uniref:regulation of nuclear pre-mRNA domain-containing protein 2-like n=1 Tax=Symsagittifera roscoffensis TaxID=84072 RepID=UPI00307BB312
MESYIEQSKFKKKFNSLDDSQDMIQNAARWILSNSTASSCSEIVSLWLESFGDAISDKKRLNMLFVANDVIQNSKRHKIPQFVTEFAKVLNQAFSVCRKSTLCSSLGHIVDIWEDRGVYRREFCAGLRGIIGYNRYEIDSKSKKRKKLISKPVMQVRPMPKKVSSDEADGVKFLRDIFFELPTTTAVLKKCSKRKKQLTKQHIRITTASNLIDRLTSYGASNDTVKQLFKTADDMKCQIELSEKNMEQVVKTLAKKIKYDSYAIKCLSRADFYFKDQYQKRKALKLFVAKSSITPLKLQVWAKAKKAMLNSQYSYPMVFNTDKTKGFSSKNDSNVYMESVSDSSETEEEYSPPRIDAMCSPPPLSRGITIPNDSSTIDVTPKGDVRDDMVAYDIESYGTPLSSCNEGFSSMRKTFMTAMQIPERKDVVSCVISSVACANTDTFFKSKSPSAVQAVDCTTPVKQMFSIPKLPKALLSPSQPVNPFINQAMSAFILPGIAGKQSLSNSPIMPTAPPIPFPPPSTFHPSQFPINFLTPPPIQSAVNPFATDAISLPPNLKQADIMSDSENHMVNINADVHAALNSLLSSNTSDLTQV